MERTGDANLAVLTRIRSKGRDLNQCLEEERQVSKLKPARMTPLYAGATGAAVPGGAAAKITTNVKPAAAGGSATKPGSRQAFFQSFEHPFVLIEEGDLYYAPIHKQYQTTTSGRAVFPALNFETIAPHCPFSYSTRPREGQVQFYSELLTDEVLDAKRKQQVADYRKYYGPAAKKPKVNKRSSFGGDPAKRQAQEQRSKPGYCECCHEKYAVLREHIRTEKHRHFAGNADNYANVDRIIERLVRATVYDFNPIINFGKESTGQIMSPAHSTIYSTHTKRSTTSSSSLQTVILPVAIEDKENDLPSGLDLTGVDRGYSEKRPVIAGSSDDACPKRDGPPLAKRARPAVSLAAFGRIHRQFS